MSSFRDLKKKHKCNGKGEGLSPGVTIDKIRPFRCLDESLGERSVSARPLEAIKFEINGKLTFKNILLLLSNEVSRVWYLV